jgi:hypothetical protein
VTRGTRTQDAGGHDDFDVEAERSEAYEPGRTLPPPGLMAPRPSNDLVTAMAAVALVELLLAGVSPAIHDPAALVHRIWVVVTVGGTVALAVWDHARLRTLPSGRPGPWWLVLPPVYPVARARSLGQPLLPATLAAIVLTAGWVVAIVSGIAWLS